MKIEVADAIEAKNVELEGAAGLTMRMLIGPDEGAPTFHMRQFSVVPGGHTPRHTHAWEHECYILAGAGTVITPDGPKPIKAGDCIYVGPNDDHQFQNTGDEELKFLCLVPKPS
ncbi:MAG: cupin domain-containing protein [Phycisphaerae bacterium]|nr:cupin domain-containing protein [Phycisphaerae bacterium]